MEQNFEKDMFIDTTALDVEWTEQAELALEYGRKWADQKDIADKADENVKYVRSTLILAANKDPDGCLGAGIKPTDAKIEAYYRTHPDYLDAKEEWLDAVHELNIIEIAKNEIAFTRKAALENLVTLHGQNYFAGPKMPRDLASEVGKRRKSREETRKEANRKVSSKRRRNKS